MTTRRLRIPPRWRSLLPFAGIAMVVGGLAGAFAWTAGWLTPARVTAPRLVDAIETGKPDPGKMQAFLGRHPEAARFMAWAGSAPWSSSFANTAYNGVHAFAFTNAEGERRYVRWSFVPQAPFEPLAPAQRQAAEAGYLTDELAARLGTLAYMVDSADELKGEWFHGLARVGLTAGASAPEILVQQVIDRIKALGAVSVRTMAGIEENIKFPLPKGLKIDAATGLEIRERTPETGPSAH